MLETQRLGNIRFANDARFHRGCRDFYLCCWPVSPMKISSRTPEGMPSECPLCGASNNIEFSDPAQDAPCPNCGHLLWASNQIVLNVTQRYATTLGTAPEKINANTPFAEMDSLDTVEMVMQLEEDYGANIPRSAAENFQTIGDLVRYIQDQRKGQGGDVPL